MKNALPLSTRVTTLLATCLTVLGCGEPIETTVPAQLEEAPGFRTKVFYLESPCQVNVEGVGMVDIEEEYIPGVVACENGNAPPEALKAQAVQARSFLYYKLFVAGQTTIRNSQADQVYSCSYRPNGPGPEHYAAAEATKGQYLTWEDSIVASFYVAGSIPPNPSAGDPFGSCRANGGSDPTNTQKWVTYNKGKTGCDVELTNLGFVPADCRGNPHNRGCASQNGQACLAEVGVGYGDMMKMYYGEDIQLVVGEGRCGGDPNAQFCIDNGDGSHCLDASTRVECQNLMPTMTESCALGCGEGACVEETPMTFCTGKADAMYCDGATRVVCTGGEVGETEVCPDGCDATGCTQGPATNNGTGAGNNGAGTNGAGNNGTGTNGGPLDPEGELDSSGLPPILGTSPGIEGGCSTTKPAPFGALLYLVVAGFIGLGRQRRRSLR